MSRILIASFIFFSYFGYGQTTKYHEVLQHYNTQKNFNGVVLVATDGKIDCLEAAGMANRVSDETLNRQAKFKIASITKTFTAVLILQLCQQGKIDLKKPFGNYFPSYKGEAKELVTIEHLLTYSSGIPDSAGKLDMKPYQVPISIDAFIDRYCSGKLESVPGTNSNYSNTEYIILHKIIEHVTKKSFETVLFENILKPLDMRNTNMLSSSDRVSGLTKSYTVNDSTKQVSVDEPYLIENYFGAGAMYSTVEDLLKFSNGIFQHKLLNQATTELMLKPNPKLNGVAFGVWYAGGYGTFSKPFIYRTGGILGSCSNWIHSIDDKVTIIVFNNTNGANLYELSEQLYLVSTGQQAIISK